MAKEGENKVNNNEQMSQGDVHGRIANSQNPAFEQKNTREDISYVDQQEGNMENGETGVDQAGNQKQS